MEAAVAPADWADEEGIAMVTAHMVAWEGWEAMVAFLVRE